MYEHNEYLYYGVSCRPIRRPRRRDAKTSAILALRCVLCVSPSRDDDGPTIRYINMYGERKKKASTEMFVCVLVHHAAYTPLICVCDLRSYLRGYIGVWCVMMHDERLRAACNDRTYIKYMLSISTNYKDKFTNKAVCFLRRHRHLSFFLSGLFWYSIMCI